MASDSVSVGFAISALAGEGIDRLRSRIADVLRQGAQIHRLRLPASDGSRIAWLHARGEVLDQQTDADEVLIAVRLSPENWARFQALEST